MNCLNFVQLKQKLKLIKLYRLIIKEILKIHGNFLLASYRSKIAVTVSALSGHPHDIYDFQKNWNALKDR